MADVWSHVRAQREDLAERIQGLTPEQWATPSLCDEWRVADVAGHLVHLAEASQLSMARDQFVHGPRPNRALWRVARLLGDQPPAELAARLRGAAGGRFRVLGLPPDAVLNEVVVHGADITRPLGVEDSVPPERLRRALRFTRRWAAVAFGVRWPGRVRVVATDVGWARGHGPEVSGPGVSVLLAMAGRRAALADLSGPGVETIDLHGAR
jgi:uncharacterized protein (TIGR03083 family)